jgi:hypothetical protein
MATTTLNPDGDVLTGWDTTFPASPTTHYTKIDEGTASPDDTDYNETTTPDDVDEQSFGAVPANTDQVTQIDVNCRARITDSGGTAFIRLELFHSAGTPVTGNPKDVSIADLGGSGVLATVQKSWTGLTLTQAQANSLQIKETFKES